MAEKVLEKKDLEEIFTAFEKRQDGKLDSLEERVGLKMKGLEERLDQKMTGLEERLDQKMTGLEVRVIHQFHVLSEGLMDHIKLLAEGHVGIVERLDRMEKENERQHLETRSLIKLSFSELDKRLTDLESQVKDLQEWRKQIEARFRT
jgi:uncharacterized coiled-coil protein SlyX